MKTKGFIKFNKSLLRMSLPVKIWLLLLVAVNGVIPLFFLNRVEAQAVLAAMMRPRKLPLVLDLDMEEMRRHLALSLKNHRNKLLDYALYPQLEFRTNRNLAD